MRGGSGGSGGAHTLVLILLLCGACAAAGAACQELELFYSKNSDGSLRPARELPVYGEPRTLQVAAEWRAPSRAAGALLAAALRALARYRRVQLAALAPTSPLDGVCTLAWHMQQYCEVIDTSNQVYDNVILSPAASWNGLRCTRFDSCLDNSRKIMQVAPRMQVTGGGAAPALPRLHVHLTSDAGARTACNYARLWEFYENNTHFYHCNFTSDERATLATVYTLPHLKDALESRIKNAELYLNCTLLEDDTRPRSELFRLLKERNSSFLFIDYDIWDGMQGVYTMQPLRCTNQSDEMSPDFSWSLRLADDFVLRPLAPQALQVFQWFLPTSKVIREVLEVEATNPQLGIEEAACSWAMNHKSTFETWYQQDYKPQHRIAVFLCAHDPDKNEYRKAAQTVQNLYRSDSELNLGLYFVEIDCRSETELSNEFIKTSMSYSWPRLLGVAAAGAGARAAAALAPGLQTALLLYDPPAAGRRLGLSAATRVVCGTPTQLVAAVQNFSESFQWTRIALISDDTELAKDILEAFNDNRKLQVYNSVLNGNISKTLEHLRSLKARIFFVNASPEIARNILCTAYTLDMTSSLEYVWILREWRGVDLVCNSDSVSNKLNISHFTFSFWWRGGNHAQFASHLKEKNNSSNILRSALNNLWPETPWPPLATPLADALELLIKSFKKFAQLYPERYYELHGNGAVRLLLDSLKNHPTSGVIQHFEYVNGTIFKPLIFLDRWIGNRSEPLFMWRAKADQVQLIIQVNEVYGADYPTDGSQFCVTSTPNESFDSRCKDLVWLGALSFIMIAGLALYLVRRVRLKRLAKRDALLTAQLMAQRDFVSNALADHYVDRAALELYDHLSQGCFGRVRYAILRAPDRQPMSVAVKELRDDVPMTEESELLREACTLAMLSHDHIVRLIGVCATGGPLLVLMEYAFFGNLCEYLCERRHLLERATTIEDNDEVFHVSAPSLTRLAREAASALAYLSLQRLVHRDIRASNCLVDAHRSLKLAEFYLARKTETGVAGEDEYLTRRRGLFPVLWMAPESLERGVFSAASDVWGLGVLLLELVTLGARPYGTWLPQRVLRYVSAGGQPPLPPDVTDSTRRILVQCWRRAPEARPAAAALAAQLAASPLALAPALSPALPPRDEHCPAIRDDDILLHDISIP